MISLVLPSGGEDRYFWFENAAFGPYNPNGNSQGDSLEWEHPYEGMSQGNERIYGENSVDHTKIEGSFRYEPLFDSITPSPTTVYPCKVSVPVYTYLYPGAPPTETWKDALHGLAEDMGSSFGYTSSTQTWVYQYAYERLSNEHWILWRVYASVSSPTSIYDLMRIDFYPGSYFYNEATRRYEVQSYWHRPATGSYSKQTSIDWTKPQDFATIFNVFPQTSQGSLSSGVANLFQVRFTGQTPVINMQHAKDNINALISVLYHSEFPVQEKDYGDLAMEAAQTVDANQVNMIAFVRDLKDIKSLIPKLQNLTKLKTLSGNYLSVEYGVLPTIDDIKSIIEACKRLKPYIDKNGFKIYTAGFSDALDQDDNHFELTQRIKLAVDDEDDLLQAVIHSLENIGVFPTFENVWDLVPYSFVIDWLIDVGGLLERIDARLKMMRLNIRYATMSRKTNARYKVKKRSGFPYVGSVEMVRYHRWVSYQSPVPALSLSVPLQLLDHWLEATALIIQRR